MKAYGLGRSRSSEPSGKITSLHLNPYTNCIHTIVGGGWETMEVLVVIINDEEKK